MALLVYINNYLHDFSAAIFLANAIIIFWVGRVLSSGGGEGTARAFKKIYRKSVIIAGVSGFGIVAGGIVRALAYRAYEWAPAAGAGQVTVLLVKHVLFGLSVAVALYLQLGPVRRMLTESRHAEPDRPPAGPPRA